MNADRFRKLAVEVEGSIESSHAGHPDFRIANKIFASLPDDESHGVLNLTPDAQDEFVSLYPVVFEPLKGTWGERGWTKVHFAHAKVDALRKAIAAASEKVKPLSGKPAARPAAKPAGKPPSVPVPKPSAKPQSGR